MFESHAGGSRFVTTQWSVVVAAQARATAEGRAALEELCRRYWPPLYYMARSMGHPDPEAKDLVQGFFAQLIGKGYIEQASQERGRFRSFLSASFRHHCVNQYRHATAQKRGASAQHISFDFAGAADEYQAAGKRHRQPDEAFDRRWAVQVVRQGLSRLEAHYAELGQALLYNVLSPHLTEDANAPAYEELAERLEMRPGALRVAMHRMRRRFGEALRAEVKETLGEDEDLEEELRYLISIL